MPRFWSLPEVGFKYSPGCHFAWKAYPWTGHCSFAETMNVFGIGHVTLTKSSFFCGRPFAPKKKYSIFRINTKLTLGVIVKMIWKSIGFQLLFTKCVAMYTTLKCNFKRSYWPMRSRNLGTVRVRPMYIYMQLLKYFASEKLFFVMSNLWDHTNARLIQSKV